MQQEQQRLVTQYVHPCSLVVWGGEVPVSETKRNPTKSSEKSILFHQVQSLKEEKEKEKEKCQEKDSPAFRSVIVRWKSGFFHDLVLPSSLLHVQSVDVFSSFFYWERVCATKDHFLHMLCYIATVLKRCGYFMGMIFDAAEVLLAFAQDKESKAIQIPTATFDRCQLNLLEGKTKQENQATIRALKVPQGCSFRVLNLKLQHDPVLFDWITMEKQILRFGFRLVETQVFSPSPSAPAICRSFVFQLMDHRALQLC
jgi:hypothetical protein